MSDSKIPILIRDLPSHELFMCNPPEVLFHYTNYEGAKGIIESHSLWLTKVAYLNDKSELKLAIDLFKTNVQAICKQSPDQELGNFLVTVANQLDCFQSTNICVASFCVNQDLLSQWRSYGNNASGIAIGFLTEQLLSLSNSHSLRLWKCIYDWDQQNRLIGELLNQLIESYKIISSADKSSLIPFFNTTFLSLAPVIKNRHFREENEWRLIIGPKKNTDPNWNARISNTRVSEYYKLDFLPDNEGFFKTIKGLVIGPSSDPLIVSNPFNVLLEKNKYKFEQIIFSQIPYKAN